MDLDAKVCYCFHVTQRKLINYLRIEQPLVPSQLSQCGGAGTGCGWCVPFLKQLFHKVRGSAGTTDLEQLSPSEYAQRRAEYLRAGKGTPPSTATPLPMKEQAAPPEENRPS